MLPYTLRPVLYIACLATLLATPPLSCHNDETIDVPREEDTEEEDEPGVRKPYDVSVAGGLSGDSVASLGCRYIFTVDALPDDGEDAEIETCTLLFELADELDPRNKMKLRGPDGTSQKLDPPTETTLEVEADAFEGADPVDGKWVLEFEERFDCDAIRSVTLNLDGSYWDP